MTDFNLVYLSRSRYGGWVTFTANLVLKYKFNLFKITNRTEKTKRNFGYNVFYQNITIDDLIKKENLFIVALDKHYWQYLDKFPDSTYILLHDPNELKNRKNIKIDKENNLLINTLKRCNCLTIRETVQKYLLDNFDVKSICKIHPFYEYDKDINIESNNYYAICNSRIDYDKNIEIILKANDLNKDETKDILLFGFENRMYVHFYLKQYNFEKYWKGHYEKTLPLIYDNKSMLKNCKFVVDLSIIKFDGGGTQYTFLDAIYNDCILILHKEWIEKGDLFKNKINCYAIGYTETPEKELLELLNDTDEELNKDIIKNSKDILNKNINVEWDNL